MYFGALGYEDVVTLLSPTLYGLKSIVHVADRFGKDYDIIFNVKNTNFLVYSQDEPENGFDYMVYIESKSVANHLSYCIGPRLHVPLQNLKAHGGWCSSAIHTYLKHTPQSIIHSSIHVSKKIFSTYLGLGLLRPLFCNLTY